MLSALDKVEVISRDPKDGSYALGLVVEAGEWDNPKAAWHLQEKVNGALAFALDGEMHRRFPDTKGKPIHIELATVDPPPERYTWLLERIQIISQEAGVPLTVRRIHLDQAA